ncbi:hypothetical protein SISSUDRAFT_134314 [Sistotremastrum suecicum HHB10207 ss-3]|uniref:DUF6533 domain-containing protein n=1 Tax=Sistotremastrum suecicum HHB10207 ss-3 TaxID=1314776 RepID=A0A166AV30_9AGAM|nr:hypothetical protein SISSUDRAFT_134314 [Sistotremastrum suecicum HHB10207 ss-3]
MALRYKSSIHQEQREELFPLPSPPLSKDRVLADLSLTIQELMAAELNAIISYAEITRSTKTCFVAGFCLSIYDILQTFPEEVEYYWRGGWNIPRALYFLTRYSPVLIEIMEMLSELYGTSMNFF